jgi:hypothetical protein
MARIIVITINMNKNHLKSKLISGLSISIIALATLLPLSAKAAGASIYLTENHTSLTAGSTLIVAVYMNGGGNAVNAVESDLNYSANKLEYVGVNYSGSAFEITAPSGGGGSGVSIARGTTGSVSGGGLIATVTFKALASSGSTAISLASSSALAVDGNPIPFSSSGTAVSFVSEAAAPVRSSDESDATSATATPPVAAAAASAPTPPPKDVPPVISAIKLANETPFSVTVIWTTNKPSSSAVDYGLDATYGLSASSGGSSTAHSVALSSSFLTPLGILHYRVKSADADGNITSSPDQTLQLPGVPVTVTVYGTNGKPQSGAVVSLDSQTATTNTKGTATVQSGLGNKQLITSYNGVTIKKPITVAKTTKPLTNYQLDFDRQPLNRWMYTSLSLLVLLLILIGFDAYLFRSKVFAYLVLRVHYWHQARPTPTFAGHAVAMPTTAPASKPVAPELDDSTALPSTTAPSPEYAVREAELTAAFASLTTQAPTQPVATTAPKITPDVVRPPAHPAAAKPRHTKIKIT